MCRKPMQNFSWKIYRIQKIYISNVEDALVEDKNSCRMIFYLSFISFGFHHYILTWDSLHQFRAADIELIWNELPSNQICNMMMQKSSIQQTTAYCSLSYLATNKIFYLPFQFFKNRFFFGFFLPNMGIIQQNIYWYLFTNMMHLEQFFNQWTTQ